MRNSEWKFGREAIFPLIGPTNYPKAFASAAIAGNGDICD
jgi:hypothetical protein